MKIAISSTGEKIENEMDAKFGRCPYFLIVEIEDKKIKNTKAVENTAAMQGGGAGITAAQIVGNEDVNAVIAINFGPRAFTVLNELKIDIYQGAPGTVAENVQQFIDEKLAKIEEATGPMGIEPKS